MNPKIADLGRFFESRPRLVVFCEVVLPSASDQPLAGRFVVPQLHDHAQRVSAEHYLPVLCAVALVSVRRDNALDEIDFRPSGRHYFVKPGARKHQQLDHARETKMDPTRRFFCPQLPQQAVNFLRACITSPRLFVVVGYALAGVFVPLGQPAPALGQVESLGQCFKAAVRRDLVFVCCVPVPKDTLVNVS